VSGRTTEENAHSEHLRADYKGAFAEWASQVSRLQAITGSPSGSFIMKEAEASVAAAEIAYRNTQDRLTDDMVVDSAKTDTVRPARHIFPDAPSLFRATVRATQ
jgi:hypothetical protein